MVSTTVLVKPKTPKAKNRLSNLMESDPLCEVEQKKNGKLLLASRNRKYFFWVESNGADPNWVVL